MNPVNSQPKVQNDPIFYDMDLPLRGLYHPLGFSVEIATNSEQVLAAAHESWGQFHKIMAEPPVQLRVALLEGGSNVRHQAPTLRGQHGLLVRVADAANFSVSNTTLGLAACWLTPSTAADRGYLRYHFIEGMSWDLLDALYLTSIHAACVRRGNRGVLLCGDSGAGKSSLSYACASRGWSFLSDDSTCLIRKNSSPVVVGNPYQIRFRDSAVKLFPELRDRKITRRLGGKLSIEVATAGLPGIKTVCESSVDHIVFLKRGQPGGPRLVPFPAAMATPWFEKVICFGEPDVRESQRASLRNLLQMEMFELHYDDLEPAVGMLETMVDQKVETSAGSRTSTLEQTHA
jgi:hypothetical protein